MNHNFDNHIISYEFKRFTISLLCNVCSVLERNASNVNILEKIYLIDYFQI